MLEVIIAQPRRGFPATVEGHPNPGAPAGLSQTLSARPASWIPELAHALDQAAPPYSVRVDVRVFSLSPHEPDQGVADRDGVIEVFVPNWSSHDYETDRIRSEEHTSELQSLAYLVCRLLLEKK